MAYTAIFLKNRAELKMRLGSSTGETIAFIMGLDFPPDEAFSIYEWNITSTAAFNDTDIVAPTIRENGQGRWFRRNIRELDPTVHPWIKSITQQDVNQWREAYQVTSTLPTTFPPSPHTHPIADVEGLEDELSDKIEVESDPTVPSWVKSITQANINSWSNPPGQANADWSSTSGVSQILNKPTSFPPSSHTHAQADITGLSTALNGKANVSHTHSISDVTGLQTALDGKISTGSTIPYSTLTGTPTIPTNTNQLTNGANFITSSGAPVQSVNGQTGTVTLSIPTTTSQLTNNSGFLTGITSAQVTSALGFTPYNSTNPSNYVTQSGARSAINLTTTGTSGAATYNSSTGVLNVPNYAGVTRAFTNNATKTINGVGVQLSTTRDAIVSYSVTHTIALTLLLAMGSSQVFLEISSDNSVWTTISQAGYSDGVAVAVALTKTTTSNVQGVVPAGFYVRLRAVTSGAGSATFNSGQEVLL